MGSTEWNKEMKNQEGASYTTEFRQYDPSIGRWLSIDSKSGKFPWQSSYCSMDNNPMVFYDPRGDEVVNGDRKTADAKKKDMDDTKESLGNFSSENGIVGGMKKKDFMNQGCEREDWKSYKKLSRNYNQASRAFASADARAKIT